MAESKDDYRTKYRPRRYDQMWQGMDDPTLRRLVRQEEKVKYPRGLIFCGEYGCGKTSAARIRGMRTSCWHWENDPVEPCGKCLGCQNAMDRVQGPDYFELDSTQEKLRALLDRMLAKSGVGKRNSHPYMPRVYFLDEAHRAIPKTQLTILQDMKEHQEVMFILSTREPEKLVPELHEFCKMYHFKAPAPEISAAKLEIVAQKEGLTLEPGVALRIAERKAGIPRDCLGALYELSFGGNVIRLDDVDLMLGDE
jgi:DNA polymerase-3 subunit gamma/tau